MLMFEMVSWWYGRGWRQAATAAGRRLHLLADMFSVDILLRTLFAPWKRIITYPGAGLEAHARAFLDNLVSRFIGFFVRIGVLLSAAVALLIFSIVSLLQVILWPVVPLAAIGLIVWGLL